MATISKLVEPVVRVKCKECKKISPYQEYMSYRCIFCGAKLPPYFPLDFCTWLTNVGMEDILEFNKNGA